MNDTKNNYYSDDYPREKCTYTVTVPTEDNGRRWIVNVFAPDNKYKIESYACSTVDNAPSLIKLMVSGEKPPKNYHLFDKFD